MIAVLLAERIGLIAGDPINAREGQVDIESGNYEFAYVERADGPGRKFGLWGVRR